MKHYYLKTYGCQMNVYDSGRMSDVLQAEGYQETDSPEKADLVLLNTCHIREKAAEKIYSEIGKLDVIKKARALEGKNIKIGIAGCVAQAEGREILRRAPVVDLVVGPQNYHRLPQLLKENSKGRKAIETEFPAEEKFDHLPHLGKGKPHSRGVSAFLTVQEGCDKFCTFCVVPYTRGAEYSRSPEKILEEARLLAETGTREITLLGQNVNAYHGAGPDGAPWTLGRLLFALAKIPGLLRLRYTTSHPRDMHDELYAAHRDLPQLMPYMHLPVQSGSDCILKAMNRQHKISDYLKVIDRLRAMRPELALSSDFIVGFPGETEEDFEATLRLVRDVGYASSFSFKYSPRPGTPAAAQEQISEAMKSERLNHLQSLLNEQHQAFADKLVGSTLPVLLEKRARDGARLYGRTPFLQSLQVEAPDEHIGEVINVKITRAAPSTLYGELMTSAYALDFAEA